MRELVVAETSFYAPYNAVVPTGLDLRSVFFKGVAVHFEPLLFDEPPKLWEVFLPEARLACQGVEEPLVSLFVFLSLAVPEANPVVHRGLGSRELTQTETAVHSSLEKALEVVGGLVQEPHLQPRHSVLYYSFYFFEAQGPILHA
jgi:hypothetical protein